jgi:hypothetical protein
VLTGWLGPGVVATTDSILAAKKIGNTALKMDAVPRIIKLV